MRTADCQGRSAALYDRRPHMSDAPAAPPLFYERHIFFCNNQRAEGHPRGSCNSRAAALGGVEKLRASARAKSQQLRIENIRCNGAGCLDRCEFGPNLVIYPEGVWYRYENTADIDEILETHVKQGGRVERLMLQPEDLPPKHRRPAGPLPT